MMDDLLMNSEPQGWEKFVSKIKGGLSNKTDKKSFLKMIERKQGPQRKKNKKLIKLRKNDPRLTEKLWSLIGRVKIR